MFKKKGGMEMTQVDSLPQLIHKVVRHLSLYETVVSPTGKQDLAPNSRARSHSLSPWGTPLLVISYAAQNFQKLVTSLVAAPGRLLRSHGRLCNPRHCWTFVLRVEKLQRRISGDFVHKEVTDRITQNRHINDYLIFYKEETSQETNR